MTWLLAQMWVYLAIAFVLGMAAFRWVFGGGGALSAEDLSAELASVRTRYEEREAEHRRLRSRLAELSTQLEDSRREARSFEAEARAAKLELEEMKIAVDAEARAAARRERETSAADATPSGPASGADAPSHEPAAPQAEPVETVSFMAALREGAPDDLTKIRGIGQKLEATLNSLGVYYYRQIADWTEADVAAMDAKLKFPGRINRDGWQAQARRLLGRDG